MLKAYFSKPQNTRNLSDTVFICLALSYIRENPSCLEVFVIVFQKFLIETFLVVFRVLCQHFS